MDICADDVDRQRYSEYLDEVRDTVDTMQVLIENLRSGAATPAQAIAGLRRGTHNLRTAGLAVNSPLVKMITHRLEEYIGEIDQPSAEQIAELQVFLDRLQSVADGEMVDQIDAAAVVRSLPAKRKAQVDFGSIEQKMVEILLVVPEKAMSHIVERELAACGYRVCNVRDPFTAIETAVRTRPDMILAAMELEQMSGVDLACAMSVIGATTSIPFALLTSYAWGHAKLKGLPPRAAVIRKGGKFGDDLAEALARVGIT